MPDVSTVLSGPFDSIVPTVNLGLFLFFKLPLCFNLLPIVFQPGIVEFDGFVRFLFAYPYLIFFVRSVLEYLFDAVLIGILHVVIVAIEEFLRSYAFVTVIGVRNHPVFADNIFKLVVWAVKFVNILAFDGLLKFLIGIFTHETHSS